MAQTPLGNLGLNYEHTLGADNWKNSYDANWIIADTLAGQGFVNDSTISAEPGSPSVGDAYILPAGGLTGTNWSSDAGAVADAIALYTNLPGQPDSSPWLYLTPREGWRVRDRANNFWLAYIGEWFVDKNHGIRTEAGDFTFANTDLEAVVLDTSASAQDATVPPDTTLTRSRIGSTLRLVATGAGTVSLVAGSGVTLTGATATSAQDSVLTLIKTAANTWRAWD